ncbi:2-aminoethylphosphonate aminotransferase [Lysinibacillus fusiformis]|uniref:2-aminoethylphosphonate aminotransferase n=1 Tax=Lysinibacillus fusiformis TaxID=28031 RepID=UPI0008816BDD|nr:2-aminoethylphosphonate--pyruvate transaminase [Lysinibacillus fusiformis]MCG7433858.1 2-aminoethylphosphonate--pyruvate transaminase [Lysinibacillus fusiformis]SCX67495.1 2-aminoethylphosphonate-pyruvate transaminase [Lysinibacillus fusiformis]SDB53067.1 2-aminoethylphosphonate-pyruvate transaminase [Lysinibacillus fusiformis]SFI98092.1 2-aminoethylphosphonate-pyruvate transaminase [Lysinibacillus fusiformis]SFT25438.1 2-aminoethylphosphonate-pyruvate transaminase [Lysinibacillus fusiformi
MIKTAVILAAGLGSRLRPYTDTQPKGFLQIYEGNPSLIELSIEALQKNGITNIIIGTGYCRSYYEDLAKGIPNVTCIHSPKYASTGSLETLMQIYPHILGEDILLLESDLLYDYNGIRELIWHCEPNVVLASNPTNSKDEVYIEITDSSNLINLSKNITELKSIYGELVGISKLSASLLDSIYKIYNENSEWTKWDYENALVALAHQNIFVHKIPQYTWCEIDNEEHLEFARKTIYPRIQLLRDLPKRDILLNPGPATTSTAVKYAQIQPDICPREETFGDVMRFVATELTRFVANNEHYSTVLFPGSGTAAVEAILTSVIKNRDTLLIVHNGAYGKRMQEICDTYSINYVMYDSPYTKALDYNDLEKFILINRHITHVALVHNETTTGLLNDLSIVGDICHKNNLTFIVDAMSSYAAIPIDMPTQNIHFLAASSNKNIQGMAGIGFVITNKNSLEQCKNHKRKSYYLDLYAQYDYFNKTGQSRFTPPVQTFYALQQAIIEAKNEGIINRYQRYKESWEVLITGLKELNLEWVIPLEHHSKIITAIYEPDNKKFNFTEMHDELFSKGFTIYPGKVGNLSTFRIANIGDINKNDMQNFIKALKAYFNKISE